MIFPPGYCTLKKGFGRIIMRKRLTASERHLRSKKELAFQIGINSQTLTRIENGKQRPSRNTLDALMKVLEFDWDEIARKGRSSKGAPPNLPENLANLCKGLRIGRRMERLRLEDVAGMTGMSISQLSRIERGLMERSEQFEIDWPDGVRKQDDDTRYRFKHPELSRLVKRAGFDDSYGFTKDRSKT